MCQRSSTMSVWWWSYNDCYTQSCWAWRTGARHWYNTTKSKSLHSSSAVHNFRSSVSSTMSFRRFSKTLVATLWYEKVWLHFVRTLQCDLRLTCTLLTTVFRAGLQINNCTEFQLINHGQQWKVCIWRWDWCLGCRFFKYIFRHFINFIIVLSESIIGHLSWS